MVPEERGAEAGINPSAVKVQRSQGGGYLVNVEGLHHLHCLVCGLERTPDSTPYLYDVLISCRI